MRARLALAQALLPQPELLILDEPSDGLDPEGIHEMRQTILRLHREFGLTILLVVPPVERGRAALHAHRRVEPRGKSFDGTMAEATRKQNWVRLRAGNFALGRRATPARRPYQRRSRPGIHLPGRRRGADEVVRLLVERGISVFEIAPQNETLEDFYLALMKPGAN